MRPKFLNDYNMIETIHLNFRVFDEPEVIEIIEPEQIENANPLPIDQEEAKRVDEEYPIENAEEDPLLIDQPNLNQNIEEAERVHDEEQNRILVPGIPEGYRGGRPAHGPLVCHICGAIEFQKCRLKAHIDGHSNEKKYKCLWTDENGIVCDKSYLKQRELTRHQSAKKHKLV